MATTPTNKPIPSEDPRDLKFNAGKIDEVVTSDAHYYTDRFGVRRWTIAGFQYTAEEAIRNYGYITMDSFEDGATLTLPNQTLRYKANGEYYRWDGEFPKIVPAGSTPDNTGGVKLGAWVSVGDASLRGELSSEDGSLNVSYKYPVNESIKRTIQSKLDEKISILDLGAKLDGVTDDTIAYKKAVGVCDVLGLKMWIPKGRCLITEPVKSPKKGIIGDGHSTSSLIFDIPDADENTYGLTYGEVGDWNDSYGKICDILITVKDESSPLNLIKLNTTSRGAVMRDCTLHVGKGWCVTSEMFFYYSFDNVVFEGRYIAKENITPSNELSGGAFRSTEREINNIHFNHCDFKFLKTVFRGTGETFGSNTIEINQCAIESIGDNLGNMAGWNVILNSPYIENIGVNKHNTATLPCCLFSFGFGDIIIDNGLLNLGECRKDSPVFNGAIGSVTLRGCHFTGSSNRTAPIMAPIMYSSRSPLIMDNCSGIDWAIPAYRCIASQWVGGYKSDVKDVSYLSPVIASSDIANHSLEFQALPAINAFNIPARPVGFVHVRLDTACLVQVRMKSILVINNAPKYADTISTFKVVDGVIVGSDHHVMSTTIDAEILSRFQTPIALISSTASEANKVKRFNIQTNKLYESATPADLFADIKVRILQYEKKGTVGIGSLY